MQLARFLIFGTALALSACTDSVAYLQEGPSRPTVDCRYQQKIDAARDAADAYYRAPQPAKGASAEEKAAFAKLGNTKDASERAKQYAEDCDAHTREWSDLRAQWQSSRAAINVASLTNTQIFLTIIEIVLLIATVAGGIISILLSRRALRQSIDDSAGQASQFRSQLDAAYVGMQESRMVAEQQSRAYVLPVSGTFDWLTEGEPTFSIRYRNAGQTPAINVRECILFADDLVPPEPGHSKVFAERPIVGGTELIAETIIEAAAHEALQRSRTIGKLIADGGDIWCFVYYDDVFGRRFRTGALLSGPSPFKEGATMDLKTHFGVEGATFFEELDEYGLPVKEAK